MTILKLSIVLVLVFISACVTGGLRVDSTYTSKSFGSRVQYVILHFTAGDFKSSLDELTNGKVSSHYLVSENPAIIYRLVNDELRAYHAGESYWKGDIALNTNSIGIEIVNQGCGIRGDTWMCAEYPREQIELVIDLVKHLVAKYGIPQGNILGHSDIAPSRKLDPGPKFPWKRLADEGLISWPNEELVKIEATRYENAVPEPEWFAQKLTSMGYRITNDQESDKSLRDTLRAIQMKYRPWKCDGTPDAETAAIIETLVAQ